MKDFDKELLHYAKGQTKKNAKHKSRKMVNGRWVYTYDTKLVGIKSLEEGKAKSHKYSKKVNGEWYYSDDGKTWTSIGTISSIKPIEADKNKLATQKAANEYKNNPAHTDSINANNYVAKAHKTQPDYNQATRQYHQYIRDRYTSATETSKRKQQSALAAKQRRQEAVRKYASKGKTLVKNLLSKM